MIYFLMFFLTIFKFINQYFASKELERFAFYVKLIDDRNRHSKKNIESLKLARRLNHLQL